MFNFVFFLASPTSPQKEKDKENRMSISTIVIIASSVFGLTAFLGASLLFMVKSRQAAARNQCGEERRSLGEVDDHELSNEVEEPQQILNNPNLSGN